MLVGAGRRRGGRRRRGSGGLAGARGLSSRQVLLVIGDRSVQDRHLELGIRVGAVLADGHLDQGTGLAAGGAEDRRVGAVVQQDVGVLLDRDLGLGTAGAV